MSVPPILERPRTLFKAPLRLCVSGLTGLALVLGGQCELELGAADGPPQVWYTGGSMMAFRRDLGATDNRAWMI